MKFRSADKQPLPCLGLRGFLDEKLGSAQFTSRHILEMLGPLVLDQFFILAINTLTTSMVSASGQDSVSATSLVNPLTLGLTVIRNEITYQLLADGFRVHTKLPSDS